MTDNELIAEFMGIGFTKSHGLLWIVETSGDMPDYVEGDTYNPKIDWNRLMPVVQKIEDIGHFTKIGYYEDLHCCYIYRPTHTYQMTEKDIICYTDFKYEKKIEAVYQAVVEFIKWYNANK